MSRTSAAARSSMKVPPLRVRVFLTRSGYETGSSIPSSTTYNKGKNKKLDNEQLNGGKNGSTKRWKADHCTRNISKGVVLHHGHASSALEEKNSKKMMLIGSWLLLQVLTNSQGLFPSISH